MIWDRDYMKDSSDPAEGEETDSSSSAPAPQPFNLFAGLQEEQLPSNTAQTIAQTNVAPPLASQKTAEGVTVPANKAVYLVIAVIALLIILVLAAL